MPDIDYYDLFGVKKDESPQETDNEVDEDNENPGETPEDVLEPETDTKAEPETAEPESGDDGASGKTKQSRKENAKYAAARRKAEQERDAAVKQAREEAEAKAKKDMDAMIAEMGLDNPYTQEPIRTVAEYEKYKATHAQKQHEQRLRDMDMTEDQYKEYVDQIPEVQEARRVTESAKQAQMKAQVEAEIKQISQMNPAIQSVEDLVKDDKYDEIFQRIQNSNISLYDAYRLTHFDDISRRSGRQQAINQAGKSHMTASKSRGEGGLSVPQEELDWYRQLNPHASEDQIAKHYNKIHQ